VIVLLSSRSIESKWVRAEIGWALRQGKEIVPVLLESIINWRPIFPLASLHCLDFRDGSPAARDAAVRNLNALLNAMSCRRGDLRFQVSVAQPHASTDVGSETISDFPAEAVHRAVTFGRLEARGAQRIIAPRPAPASTEPEPESASGSEQHLSTEISEMYLYPSDPFKKFSWWTWMEEEESIR
jgi:hypothetical protein